MIVVETVNGFSGAQTGSFGFFGQLFEIIELNSLTARRSSAQKYKKLDLRFEVKRVF